jgi:two-component system, OmpR family, sensor kinase
MRTLTIRLRLTLWYTFIFGALLVCLTSAIYMVHRVASYRDLDEYLINVTSHIQNEVERDLREGKTLTEVRPLYNQIYMGEVFLSIKNEQGKEVSQKQSSLLTLNLPLLDQQESLHTFSDPSSGRFRIATKPITDKGKTVGYLQTGISLKPTDTGLTRFGWSIASFTLLGLILAVWCGWVLAKKILYRVELISQTARAISASQAFSGRVSHVGPMDELGELAETFNEMLASLEKAYMSQRRFIADASHELRAPLTTIRGNLDLLDRMRNISTTEKDEILKDLREEAVRMSKMVAELLTLARADVGQEMAMDVVNVAGMIKQIETEIHMWEKKAEISFKSDVPLRIWGNADLFKQLLLIMVENALKYTPEGGKVFVSAWEESEQVTIVVEDTGIGIKEEELPFLFKRFFRTSSARMHSPEGVGLGLTIAKLIVDQHQGTISIKSEPGKGSSFCVKLPKIRSA